MLRAAIALVSVLVLAPATVLAHGIGQRIDLPIPLDLYIVGGAAVVAFSFLAVWFLPPNFIERLLKGNTLHAQFLDWTVSSISTRIVAALSSLFFVFLLYAGFWGNTHAEANILPTTVWIVFAVGVTFFSAFIGNVWSVLNPVVHLYSIGARILAKLHIHEARLRWRSVWGVWPAVIGFLLFRWIENVYSAASEPRALALLLVAYTIYSFTGMFLFGRRVWLKNADPFAVFFSFLAKFSLFTVQVVDGTKRVLLRLPASGLLQQQPRFSEVIFVLAMLSSVTADGFFETPTMLNALAALHAAGVVEAFAKTGVILLLLGAFAAIYLGMAALVHALLPKVIGTAQFASLFIFSLLPISVAYEFAHYASLLVLEGQRFIALLSDPLGRGWDVLGTATWEINYNVINIKTLWNIQIGAIIVGHVIAVLIAHAIAERVFKDRNHVLASQYPMLIVMLFYTMFSLWIIAQPVVA